MLKPNEIHNWKNMYTNKNIINTNNNNSTNLICSYLISYLIPHNKVT